ncbi:hypothetical protein D9758_003501 [Tetrapyrgos nigripes]|uniref:F-box domain-containing protein n=1 Tax=Tetrapyrgos nigripes TaxID=182062 RepID=A0A8H5GVC0_9AGAR|nr:hypothetical protein D9758_003501 [Tetrapyrgos nigripes]
MHSVLLIPELRQHILHLVDRKSLRACVFVCDAWKADALHAYWEIVHDIETVARALGAVRKRDTGDVMVFDSLPNLAAWERFDTLYSRAVRELHVDLTEDNFHLLQTIGGTRPASFKLFPKLRRLYVSEDGLLSPTDDFATLVLLMNPNVEHFDWFEHPLRFRSASIWKTIAKQMSHLTSLSIWFEHDIDKEMSRDIANLCTKLPALVKADLPTGNDQCDWSNIFGAVAEHCQSLQSLRCGSVCVFQPSHERIPFPSLTHLDLPVCTVEALTLLLETHPMPSLRILEVDIDGDHTVTSAECLRLFGLIGSLPQITELSLYYYMEASFGFNDFRSLLQAETLSRLYLGSVTVSMTDVELFSIGRSLPCLESLELDACPDEVPDTMPTLRGLIDLAKHALKLRHLMVLISPVFHPSDSDDGAPDALKLDTLSRFQRLEFLHIGQSRLDPKWSSVVVCVLDQILPVGCKFELWETPWEVRDDMVRRSDEEWGKVGFALRHRGVVKVSLPKDGSL